MKTPYPNVLTDSERKLARNLTIAAAAAYGLILVGFMAFVFAGDAVLDDAAKPGKMSSYGIDGNAAALQPGRLSLPRSSNATDGAYGVTSAPAPAELVNAGPAVVSIPEVDEMVENFSAPTGDSGFGPSMQTSTPPSANGRQVTERTNR